MYQDFCKMKMVVSLKMVSAHFQTTHWYFFRRAKHEAPFSVLTNCAGLPLPHIISRSFIAYAQPRGAFEHRAVVHTGVLRAVLRVHAAGGRGEKAR